ncbi:hypothetical protein SNEBB_000483 [Seison nebaliae]|nr:hypothetical protein SNEBB_000483 [Seison nebaliae]
MSTSMKKKDTTKNIFSNNQTNKAYAPTPSLYPPMFVPVSARENPKLVFSQNVAAVPQPVMPTVPLNNKGKQQQMPMHPYYHPLYYPPLSKSSSKKQTMSQPLVYPPYAPYYNPWMMMPPPMIPVNSFENEDTDDNKKKNVAPRHTNGAYHRANPVDNYIPKSGDIIVPANYKHVRARVHHQDEFSSAPSQSMKELDTSKSQSKSLDKSNSLNSPGTSKLSKKSTKSSSSK